MQKAVEGNPWIASLFEKIPLDQKKKDVVVIAGPTAVGKTDFSLSLAKDLNGEIISADSMQVYKGMDIGTAKATKEQIKIAPHHLLDIRNVSEPFSAVDYAREAKNAIVDVLKREKVPIVVGGSGFYIHTLLYGPPMGPPPDKEIRKYLEEQVDKMGIEVLYERLQMLDPIYASSVTENDRQKIIRALEIIILLKKPVSSLPKPEKMIDEYRFHCWFLYLPKDELYKRVENRCETMIQQGFLDEVRLLEKEGICKNSQAAQAIGYKEALAYLHTEGSEKDFEEFVSSFKRSSRHYVKRQLTWFKKENSFRWLDLSKIPLDRAKEYVMQDFERGFSL